MSKGGIKKIKKAKRISILILIVISIVMLISVLNSCKVVPDEIIEDTRKGIEVEVEIKEGMILKEISNLLEEEGIVDNGFLFRLYVEQEGMEKKLLPGKYKLVTGSEYNIVLEKISAGVPETIYRVTIPEGYVTYQTINKIGEELPFIEISDLEEAININNYNYEFLDDSQSLEGFLFPKTYDVSINYTAMDIIEMMLAQYQYEVSTLDYSNAKVNSFSAYDILIIASMIEREAYIPEERELISAVIHNRLKIDMSLGIDATLAYYLNKWDDPLTKSDLEIDTEYNTRLYTGLPPTPICNPGLASIEAALNPADVDYLYFVITDEENHIHSFSNSFDEHEQLQNNTD